MRKRIVAGNWKMNKTVDEAVQLAEALKKELGAYDQVQIVLCPPFTDLTAVYGVIKGTPVKLGAQNMYWEEKGAYTGEISADMLKSVGCDYVILGHSERRQYFYETDEKVNKKIRRALDAGLTPIVCVGETLRERELSDTEKVLETQVRGCLTGLSGDEVRSLVIAYEPVWAIGTGVVATTEQAQRAHQFIRGLADELYDRSVAEAVRIQYGGSLKPDNAAELLAQPDIDGGLVGGASLDADTFLKIIYA